MAPASDRMIVLSHGLASFPLIPCLGFFFAMVCGFTHLAAIAEAASILTAECQQFVKACLSSAAAIFHEREKEDAPSANTMEEDTRTDMHQSTFTLAQNERMKKEFDCFGKYSRYSSSTPGKR